MVLTCAWISLTCRNKHVNDDEHMTCHCNILWFVVHNYGCDILWENGFCVIYICDGWYIYVYIWNACVDGMQKTKQKLNFCLFAEGNDQGPRQRRVLCRGPSHCPRQRFKKKFLQHLFAEGHGWRPSAKTFFKKNKILCRGPSGKPSAKIFQEKKE